jgi:hypothetical protein
MVLKTKKMFGGTFFTFNIIASKAFSHFSCRLLRRLCLLAIKKLSPVPGREHKRSRGSTRICPSFLTGFDKLNLLSQDIFLGPITGPAVPLTRNSLSDFRSRVVFADYTWGRLSAGGLRLLSGIWPVTRPGHRVSIFVYSNYKPL